MKGVSNNQMSLGAFAAMGCAGGVREVPGFGDKEKPQRKSFNRKKALKLSNSRK